MSSHFNILFNLFLFLFFPFTINARIIISPLGKTESLESFLTNESLTIKTENLFFLAANNQGKITINNYSLEIYKLNDTKLQSHNMRKSKLYIPNSCMNQMKKHSEIQLDKDKGIVILVSDSNNLNRNNIPDNYFIIRHNSKYSSIKYINSKYFDFSFCKSDPILFEDEINIKHLSYNNTNDEEIDIDTILYGRKFSIDLFNPNHDFFNDICFKFTSEKGTDVTLESRVEDYYQNITFCDDKKNSHYIAFNYSEDKNSITYRCSYGYGFYKAETDSNNNVSYIDLIDSELKTFVSVSNFKVITCFTKFLNLRDIIRNYGGMICILVLIIQIICFLLFCFRGIKSIKKQINDLFSLGKEIIVRRQSMRRETTLNYEEKEEKEEGSKDNLNKNMYDIKNNNNIKNINTNINNENDTNNNITNTNINNDKSPFQKANNSSNTNSNPPKNEKNNDNINNNINKSINNNKNKMNKSINKELNNKLSGSIKKSIKIENNEDKATNLDVKSDSSQLYDYSNDELNEMPFDKAIKKDKRHFCSYYCNILLVSHIILNVFCRQSDYNLFVVKLGLLFLTFPINLTFNILFFTNKSIKLTYIKSMDDITAFWDNIANTVYSSILSLVFLMILKLLCLTHNSVRKLRKIKDVNKAKEESVCVFRCIKFRIFIYFILSFAFIIGFGFYVISFCAVFENTQVTIINSTFTSWLISLAYPFIIFFFASCIRSLSYACESKCLYCIKQILQWF